MRHGRRHGAAGGDNPLRTQGTGALGRVPSHTARARAGGPVVGQIGLPDGLREEIGAGQPCLGLV